MNLIQIAVALFGGLIGCLSILCVICPAWIINTVTTAWQHKATLYLAVVVRLVLGVLLLMAAANSRFPVVFEVFGWIAIVAAVVIVVVGRQLLGRLIAWFAGIPAWAVRSWALFGVLFGGFMVYGVI